MRGAVQYRLNVIYIESRVIAKHVEVPTLLTGVFTLRAAKPMGDIVVYGLITVCTTSHRAPCPC